MFNSVRQKTTRKDLIIHADDLGLQFCFNYGILKGHREGLITSTCLRANGLAFDHAISEVVKPCPDLGTGVHICLNEGRTVAPLSKVGLLADQNGYFRHSHVRGFLFLAMNCKNQKLIDQTEFEVRAQIEKLLKHVSLDHINGHQHVHAIPWVFELSLKLAEEYKIPFIRLPKEPFSRESLKIRFPGYLNILHYFNLQRWCGRNEKMLLNSKVESNDVFLGLLHTSAMTKEITKVLLSDLEQGEIVEILFHPTIEGKIPDKEYIDSALQAYCQDPNRKLELEAVLSADLKTHLVQSGFNLTNYRKLNFRKMANAV